MEPKGWYSEEYHYYTPEEIKQQEKVERRRLEREANIPPPPVRATGSMGKTRYIPGTAKKPAAKPVPTTNKYGVLTELETDYRTLPWFLPKSIPDKPKKPKVNPKDYISYEEYAKQNSTPDPPKLAMKQSEACIDPLAPVPGSTVALVSTL